MVESNDNCCVTETLNLCCFFVLLIDMSKRQLCFQRKPQYRVLYNKTRADCMLYISMSRKRQTQPQNTASMAWLCIRISVKANQRQSRETEQIRSMKGWVIRLWRCCHLRGRGAGESKPDKIRRLLAVFNHLLFFNLCVFLLLFFSKYKLPQKE